MKKKTLNFYCDEWYPWYGIDTCDGDNRRITVSPYMASKIKKGLKDAEKIQDLIQKLLKEQGRLK